MVEAEQAGELGETNPRRFGPGEYVGFGQDSGKPNVWRVLNYTGDGEVIIVKKVEEPTASGREEGIVKTVHEDELAKMALPESGATVRVRRSSGELEDGWTVSDYQGENVIVAKGSKVKSIPLSELMGTQEQRE